MSPSITQLEIDMLLSVIRLGDADRLGWWRSHSMDETGKYLLAHMFPNTWMATGVELAMESSRIRHNMALNRPTAVHLFSDYLPFHRELRAWLIQRKLDKDFGPLTWLPDASVEQLRRISVPQQLASGAVMGSTSATSRGDLSTESAANTGVLYTAGFGLC